MAFRRSIQRSRPFRSGNTRPLESRPFPEILLVAAIRSNPNPDSTGHLHPLKSSSISLTSGFHFSISPFLHMHCFALTLSSQHPFSRFHPPRTSIDTYPFRLRRVLVNPVSTTAFPRPCETD